MTISRFAPAVAALTLALLTPLTFAQYVWTDEKGVRQFSDTPPPATVPQHRILKQPAAAAQREPAAAAATAGAPASAKTPLSTAERNADFNKRRMEQAELEKKTAQEAERKAVQAKNCERIRDFSRQLQSGERIARVDSNGERAFLSDDQRAKELREAQRMLGDCK